MEATILGKFFNGCGLFRRRKNKSCDCLNENRAERRGRHKFADDATTDDFCGHMHARRERVRRARRHENCGCMANTGKPANFLAAGESGKIVDIKGRDKVKTHLSNLGFVNGTEIILVSEVDGSVIFKVKDCRVALGKEMARRILVV